MSFFILLMQMIPSIIGIVKQVETAIPGAGHGPQKLDLVLNTVNTAAMASQPVATAIQGHDLNGAITGIVNATVATMNATGAFNKAPAATPIP